MYEKRECSRAKQQSQIDHIGNCKILEYPFVLSHSHIAAATWQQYIHTNVRKSTPRICVNVKVMIKPTTNQPANDRFVVQRQRRCGSIAIATIIHLYIGIIDSVISYSVFCMLLLVCPCFIYCSRTRWKDDLFVGGIMMSFVCGLQKSICDSHFNWTILIKLEIGSFEPLIRIQQISRFIKIHRIRRINEIIHRISWFIIFEFFI